MKVLFKSLLYYIKTVIFDIGVFAVGRMKRTSFFANYLSRRVENMGEKLIRHKKALEKYF